MTGIQFVTDAKGSGTDRSSQTQRPWEERTTLHAGRSGIGIIEEEREVAWKEMNDLEGQMADRIPQLSNQLQNS